MITPQPISLLNTGFPVLVLAVLAIVLPRLLLPAGNLSQLALALAVGISALVLLGFGAALIATGYAGSGMPVWPAFLDAKTAMIAFFLRLSASTIIIWAPLLALTWFSMAQGIERRRGQARARRGQP